MKQREVDEAFIATMKDLNFAPFLIEKMKQRMRDVAADRGPEWDLMKWYVTLANTEVQKLRAGDLLNLQEELMNFFGLGSFDIKSKPPDIEDLDILQKTLFRHLHELFDAGQTKLGPFSSTTIASRMILPVETAQKMFPRIATRIKTQPPPLFFGMTLPTDPKEFLLQEFARLLVKYGSLLSMCPHCKKIFLQLRKSAIYCDRKCQRVAVMRRIRERQDNSKNDIAKPKPRGRQKHGTIRR